MKSFLAGIGGLAAVVLLLVGCSGQDSSLPVSSPVNSQAVDLPGGTSEELNQPPGMVSNENVRFRPESCSIRCEDAAPLEIGARVNDCYLTASGPDTMNWFSFEVAELGEYRFRLDQFQSEADFDLYLGGLCSDQVWLHILAENGPENAVLVLTPGQYCMMAYRTMYESGAVSPGSHYELVVTRP